MMEEIFRFMAIRSPEPEGSQGAASVSTAYANSNFQDKLLTARQSAKPYIAMRQAAEAFVQGDKFVHSLAELPFPLEDLIDQSTPASKDSLQAINAHIQSVFHESAAEIVQSGAFSNAVQRLSDSLIAICLIGTAKDAHVTDLVRGRQWLALLEAIAANASDLQTKGGVRRLLERPVALPPGLFPISVLEPTASESIEEEEESSDIQRNIEMLKGRLDETRIALNEIAALRASDFEPPVEAAPSSPSPSPPTTTGIFDRFVSIFRPQNDLAALESFAETAIEKPWTLKPASYDQLSTTTQQVLSALDVKIDTLSWPGIVTALEVELADIGGQVATAAGSTKVLNYGSVFFPDSVWTTKKGALVQGTSTTYRVAGVADLQIVRQKLLKYELGEIAHVENVLKGESKKRVHRRARRTETTLITEKETVNEEERDLQSTERFELESQTNTVISEDSKLAAGVTVNASYGPYVDVTSDFKYTKSNSKQEAIQSASSYARDITNRSVHRLKERVREERIRKSIEEFEESNHHELSATNAHVVGIYRWLDKLYECQLVNYGRRLMLEFIIPEPGAFVHYAKTKTTPEGVTLNLPKEPLINGRPLKPSDIQIENYQKWVADYQVSGVEGPPPRFVVKAHSAAFKYKEGGKNAYTFETESKNIDIEEDYSAYQARGVVTTNTGFSTVTISLGKIRYAKELNLQSNTTPGWFSFDNLSDWQTGEIPFAIQAAFTSTVAITMELVCKRTSHSLNKWRQKTYDKIITAYLELMSRYDEQLAAAAIEQGVAITGRSPSANREIERHELKKGAITLLTDHHLGDTSSITEDSTGAPIIDLTHAKTNHSKLAHRTPGDYIQFFEQAFDWTKIYYTLYPYFWARKERWTVLQQLDDKDPLHAEFLKAGAARVLAPVRPGYETAILSFLETGVIWDGAEPPDVYSPLYVPLYQEFKEKQSVDTQGTPVGEPWQARLPTTLVILQQDSTLPDWTGTGSG